MYRTSICIDVTLVAYIQIDILLLSFSARLPLVITPLIVPFAPVHFSKPYYYCNYYDFIVNGEQQRRAIYNVKPTTIIIRIFNLVASLGRFSFVILFRRKILQIILRKVSLLFLFKKYR